MRFIPKPGKPNCNCCGQKYDPDQMQYIGYQIIDDAGNGFPLFDCPCGTTTVGYEPKTQKNEKSAKVSKNATDKSSN